MYAVEQAKTARCQRTCAEKDACADHGVGKYLHVKAGADLEAKDAEERQNHTGQDGDAAP